jgi:hypothetical protein
MPLNSFDHPAVKQGLLEVSEGERGALVKGTHGNMQWKRSWISLAPTKLLLYDPHTQDLLDPFQSIEVKTILHCKAEDTCVFR